MSTSGAVVASRYGHTVYSYPTSGSFAADRTAIIGNTSSAAAQVGADLLGFLTPSRPRNYRTTPILLDGTDYSRTTYGTKTVVVPVVIYETTAYAALVEWRRIVAAFEPRHQRAAIATTDPNSSGQGVRWLTNLILDDISDIVLEHDNQNYYIGRLIFETDGSPFWTAEPIAANLVTVSVAIAVTGVSYALNLTNAGTVGAWPSIGVAGLNTNATVALTLAETGEQVVITDVESGNTGIEFDRRVRDPDDDNRVSPASVYFQIPPGTSRVDVVVTEAVAGNSAVSASILPRYGTV